MNHVGRTRREIANAEAARWVLEFASGEPTAEQLRAFEIWRAQSREHELAYEWTKLVWQRTDRLQALRPPGDIVDATVLARIAAPRRSEAARGVARPASRLPKFAALAAGIVIACVVGWWALGRTPEPVLFATSVGEQRTVLLEDGTRLVLNTSTEVSVGYSRSSRNVTLVQGESLFDVEPDPDRPFIVGIGSRTVRAVGTVFNIRREAESAIILVTEGVVEVAGPRDPGAVRLPAGSIGFEGRDGVTSRAVAAGEIERTLSWRFGSIILAGETLDDAAAEFNRYNEVQITVADPSIAGLRLGGYFNAHDIDAFVAVLASTYAIDVTATGSSIALRGTPETPARMRDGGTSVRPL